MRLVTSTSSARGSGGERNRPGGVRSSRRQRETSDKKTERKERRMSNRLMWGGGGGGGGGARSLRSGNAPGRDKGEKGSLRKKEGKKRGGRHKINSSYWRGELESMNC